jgi:hypothetical protein
MKEQMTVIYCKPYEKAQAITIPNTLEAMQELVDGYIEAIYPFKDEIAIVCNEDGKFGCEPNRALYDEDGNLIDILFGSFFICGLGEEDFQSIPEDLLPKYLAKFAYAQLFF